MAGTFQEYSFIFASCELLNRKYRKYARSCAHPDSSVLLQIGPNAVPLLLLQVGVAVWVR